MDESIKCPSCRSDQVSAQKRGFSAGKAVAGVVLTGGIGALAGLHGSDTIELYCLRCGHSWKPALPKPAATKPDSANMVLLKIGMTALFILPILWLVLTCS